MTQYLLMKLKTAWGEADVLMRLYGEEKVSLADGMSQLIRGSRTNWKPTISDNLPEVKKAFHECLRMKKNLGIFANAVAERADLNWSIQPNSQAAGGRVIISTIHSISCQTFTMNF